MAKINDWKKTAPNTLKIDWMRGNDFGHRAYIGEISLNIGQICLIFNSDTGRFE